MSSDTSPFGVITGASPMYVITPREFPKVRETARVPCPITTSPCTLAHLLYSCKRQSQIAQRSIEEFEYLNHVHGGWDTDAHSKTLSAMYTYPALSVKANGIKHAVDTRLSQEARNTITIENDENKWGIDASLELAEIRPVLIYTHHWCPEGEYILTQPR